MHDPIVFDDDIEMPELRSLAPEGPHRALPGWEETREVLRQQVTKAPGRSRAKVPRNVVRGALIGASVMTMVGVGSYAAAQSGILPWSAGQAGASAPASALWRSVPQGTYLVETSVTTETRDWGASHGSADGRLTTRLTTRTTVVDSTCHAKVRIEPGSSYPDLLPGTADLGSVDLGGAMQGMPLSPAALGEWLRQHDTGPAGSRDPGTIVWVAAADLLRHPLSSTQLRQALVAVLMDNPGTTVASSAANGSVVVTLTHTVRHDDGTTQVESLILDNASGTLLGSSERLTGADGGLVEERRVRISAPLHLTSRQP